MTVVIGVDGAGRTHRLRTVAATADTPVTTIDSAGDTAVLAAAEAGGGLVVVDDAHRLPADVLTALADAARRGVPMVIARRPTLDRPELVALDEVVAERGGVETLTPLDEDAVAELVGQVTGDRPIPELARSLREDTAGLPALVVLHATAGTTATTAVDPPAGLVVRIQHLLARLPAGAPALARVLSLQLALPDAALAAACDLDRDAFATAVRHLHDHGMLVPGTERMIPVVARAVQADLPPAGRRHLHETAASALLDCGADPVIAAGLLRTARARTPTAATVYAAAGDRLRFAEPAAATDWYDLAGEAGADPAETAPGRAEAAALLGRPASADVPASSPGAPRMQLVAGAVAAHQGRSDRAAEALRNAPAPGPVLAVPSLMAIGQPREAAAAATGPAPSGLRRLAEAAAAVADPDAALPLLIEAAEDLERTPVELVLPDTPHALGAVVAALVGDTPSAEHLLAHGQSTGCGGPVAAERHRLLLAWVGMRTGRYDRALAILPRLDGALLGGRERLLAAALAAGIARRSGDIAQLRDAWAMAEPVLARRSVDLFQLEPVEELLVAAARLREHRRIEPVWRVLTQVLEGLGHPPAWTVAAGWISVQLAAVDDDPAAAQAAAARMRGAGAPGARQRAQATAAGQWAAVLAGEVDADAVLAAVAALVEAGLPWEASRLAGHAAIRTGAATTARRLLERARELSGGEARTGGGPVQAAGVGLTERELDVGRMVLAGRTHKEIGAQLYLSPKTVEHHVARIRTKLGAVNRAELLAALRNVVPDEH